MSDQRGDSREFSQTFLQDPATPVTRDLFYATGTRNYSATARLSYVEPLAEKWTLSLNLNGNGYWRNYGKDAFERSAGQAGFNASVIDKKDYTRKNEFYSSATDNRYIYIYEILQLQYKKNATSLQFGAQMQETLNETRARSLGRDTETGLGEWLLDWSPYFNFRWAKQQTSFNLSYSGRSTRPSATLQLPVLDISVPTRLQLGNLYLKPAYTHSLSGSIYSNNPQKQRNFNLFLSLSMNRRQMVTASWYDPRGIQYAIPVNSAKPAFSGNVYFGYQLPLTPDKRLRLQGGLNATLNRSVSYQNTRRIPGLDVDTFDYARFMESFWGDERGGHFYSGESGFSESLTRNLRLGPNLGLSYRGDRFNVSLRGGTSYQQAHYSLDSAADTRTWSSFVNFDTDWTTTHGWELGSEAGYYFYKGFPSGYNEPYLMWNIQVTKNIKQFAIGFHLNDVLNSTRTTRHIASENYVEDVMYNQLGRNIALTLKLNFGKLNATRGRKASNAAMGAPQLNSLGSFCAPSAESRPTTAEAIRKM